MSLTKEVFRKLHADSVLHAMAAGNVHNIEKLNLSLKYILDDYLKRGLPLRRITLLASLLRLADNERIPPESLSDRLLFEQKEDGGWIDCEDTAWNIFLLATLKSNSAFRLKAVEWLDKERSPHNGWGFCKRDSPNIPLTSQVQFLVPELRTNTIFSWLRNEWKNDLFSPVNLNYKGAWYLLVLAEQLQQNDPNAFLFYETIDYLIREQRQDGGWGPWKDHPAPTCPSITGLVSFSLTKANKYSPSEKIAVCLQRSLSWFEKNQLESGLFPVHYIEEGSAWGYLGWHESYNCLL